MVQQRLEAYHLGTAHQCFFHLDSVIDSVLKIGRFAGLGTEGLLVGKIKKKIVEKNVSQEKLDIFQGKKKIHHFFFVSISFIHSHVESGFMVPVT